MYIIIGLNTATLHHFSNLALIDIIGVLCI